MATRSAPITFLVPGRAERPDAAATRGAAAARVPTLARGEVRHAVRVGATRGAGDVRVDATPGEDVVVLHLANGPALVLDPEHARDLMQAQRDGGGAAAVRGGEASEVRVPAQLRWRGPGKGPATRGRLADVLLSLVEVIRGPAADLVAGEVVRAVDGQVDPGVYALEPGALGALAGSERKLDAVPGAAGPILVLLHGTFVDTASTFGKLWTEHPDGVRALFRHYGGRVYALDHATLGVSPIANARMLAERLPEGARLHLLTHSRGGLVADALARACACPSERLSAADLEPFEGAELAAERRELAALVKAVKRRGVTVERAVRVACPARGTLLASKRLDAFLSVFRWTLELAHVPLAPGLVDFLASVAQRRLDWTKLPGLAAQVPDSALVRWIHAVDEAIPGALRVIAGDLEADSLGSWLKTLVADGFFWTDNDLVVQTRSMYGGAPRAGGATFLLDAGGAVTHFDYFRNARTADAAVRGLTEDAPAGFRTIGPLSWAGESATGVRAAPRPIARADVPAAILLPGILGSHLEVDGTRIWLSWRFVNGLSRLAYGDGDGRRVAPDGLIGAVYDDLADHLARTHEVIPFAFDWRAPLEDEARRLAAVVDAALAAREASGKPVRLVAHSMGGLLARTLQLEAPATWDRLMARPGARLLMLGTPNAGSWVPMQVLSGDDDFGNTVATFGAPFHEHRARELMAGFPGLLQLQAALLDPKLGLDHVDTWRRLADEDLAFARQFTHWHADPSQLEQLRWGVPAQAVLDAARALRARLDAQLQDGLGAHLDRLALVVGRADATPDGFEVKDGDLAYLDTPDGDGRVPLASARLPGVRTWRVDRDHGKLPEERAAFDAYVELLEQGDTARLPRVTDAVAAARGAVGVPAARTRSRPARTRAAPRPPVEQDAIYAVRERPAPPPAGGAALRVVVENGSLRHVAEPIVVGHYRSLRLTGTEQLLDRLVGGSMRAALELGAYPDRVGTEAVFVNGVAPADDPSLPPRPEAVVVVGLGDEGNLRSPDLAETVRQGVIAWARRHVERPGAAAQFDLAATLIGSGGKGMSAGQAAAAVAQGVLDANARLAQHQWPQVVKLRLVEKYLDRATEAWRALRAQAVATPGRFTVGEQVLSGPGAAARPLRSSYRGADYDFLSVNLRGGIIEYTIDTRRARSEVHARTTQARLVQDLVKAAAGDGAARRPGLGRTLYNLLVPVELQPLMLGTSELQMDLNVDAAAIPWELLDPGEGAVDGRKPWAIRTKLLRKLRTPTFRQGVVDASLDASALVIGEPLTEFARLPGAREEARTVAGVLGASLGAARVRSLFAPDPGADGPDAATVLDALYEQPWRILHVAGHGAEPTPDDRQVPEAAGGLGPARDPGGVVLSEGARLGPCEVEAMRVVPELVFLNCCFLGAMRPEKGRTPPHAPRFAATIAEALIELGVRCVVAAGWAVDDLAAQAFAATFYARLLEGDRFVEAVARARERAADVPGNTWAAYQCYGDPDWTLVRQVDDAQAPGPAAGRAQADLESIGSAADLRLELDAVVVESGEDASGAEDRRARVAQLAGRFAAQWGGSGAVAEGFGAAFAAVGEVDRAIDWYGRALAANDGTASVKAAERLGNLLARAAAEGLERAVANARPPARRAKVARPPADAVKLARVRMRKAIALLERLDGVQPTVERESLCASAYKRKAIVEALAGNAAEERRAIAKMRAHYARAEALARDARSPDWLYPALNRMGMELILRGAAAADTFAEETVDEVRSAVAACPAGFWPSAAGAELSLYEAIAAGRLAARAPAVARAFADLQRREADRGQWASVRDQARFVLSRLRTSDRDRPAVERLLAQLDGYAGGARTAAALTPPPRPAPAARRGTSTRGPPPSRAGARRRAPRPRPSRG